MSADAHAPSSTGVLCNAAAGASAGVIAATFVCPLDVIKTRFQVHGLPKHGHGAIKDGNLQISIGDNMIAALGAVAATTIATNPLWFVKTRLQVGPTVFNSTQKMRSSVMPYRSTLSALRRISHEEGIRGLYSGLVPALAGISHVAIQFPTYEKLKIYLADRENTAMDKLSACDVAVASSISKIFASTLTYPREI